MGFREIVSIRKAATLKGRGRTIDAIRLLDSAIEAGDGDIRLKIRRAIYSGDYSFLTRPSETMKNPAAWLLGGIEAFKNGDLDLADQLTQSAINVSANNNSANTLNLLINYSKGLGGLQELGHYAPLSSLRLQALVLATLEKSIMLICNNDHGATGREEELSGPLGWIIKGLDDFAIWTYWLLATVINFAFNIANTKKLSVYRLVNSADRDHGLRQLDSAIVKFEQALELDGDNIESLESLVMLTVTAGRYEEADAYVKRLLKVSPLEENPEYEKWLADVHYFNGEWSDATKMYLKSYSMDPHDYITPYRLGLLSLMQDKGTEAIRWFEISLSRIHPGLLEERMARLEELLGAS